MGSNEDNSNEQMFAGHIPYNPTGMESTEIFAIMNIESANTASILDVFCIANADAFHGHGPLTNMGSLPDTATATISTGDRLVIVDASADNVLQKTSIAFNTSSTTSFLRNDGT